LLAKADFQVRLTEVKKHRWVRLVSIEGDECIARKLAQYGLFPGDLAQVVLLAPLNGPLLLEADGREIALARRVASQILVEPV
jgi:Fe2+ transport system protein FeoA